MLNRMQEMDSKLNPAGSNSPNQTSDLSLSQAQINETFVSNIEGDLKRLHGR